MKGIEECYTQRDKISSQGMMSSADQRCVLIHDSTYPPILHRLEYGPEYNFGINMDRGGFGQRADGSYYACLFDGTGGGGISSAYAAQDFTEQMLHELSQAQLSFYAKGEDERHLATELMVRCSFAKVKGASGMFQAFSGDATCVFVDISAQGEEGMYRLSGGALGDSGIIHITREGATLFDTILKDVRTNMSDTGGCLGRGGMIYRPDNICVVSEEIAAGDFVVLASDGVLDNLARGEENEILSLIVKSAFFDLDVREMREKIDTLSLWPTPWDEAIGRLPNTIELLEFLKPFKSAPQPLNAMQIANRLNHYVRLMTAKKSEALEKYLQEWEKVASSSAVIEAEQERTLYHIGQKFKEDDRKLAGKCDDCLIIVISAA